MNNNGDLSHYIKTVQNELNNPPGRHLSDEELMTLLRNGDLPAHEQETLRAHLAQCSQCIDTFKEMRDFVAYDPPTEAEIDEIAKERVWRTVRQQSLPATEAPSVSIVAPPVVVGRRSVIAYAVAACFAIMFIITGILVVNLSQQKQSLQSQLQNEQKQNAEKQEQIKSLEAQRQSPAVIPPESTSPNADLERQIARLKEPSVNTPIFDVFPTDSIERGTANGSDTADVPTATKSFVLLLNAAGKPQYSTYQVEILDSGNKTVWSGAGLKRDNLGNFSLSLTKDFLPRGNYRLRVYGISGQKRERVADYSVRIN